MSVEIKGLRELLSNLSKKEDEILRAARKANLEGGKIIADRLERNTPRSNYSGKNPQTRLSSAVAVSGNRGNSATGESYVAVGFNKSANFRAHFQEFGTISQGAQGYMTKTVHEVESDVVKGMEQAIRSVLS